MKRDLSFKLKVVGYLMSLFTLLMLGSCDVHQFPEPQMVPDKPNTPDKPDDPNNPDIPDNPDNPDNPDPDDPSKPDEPEPEPVDPVDPDKSVKVSLGLLYSPDFYVWEHTYDPVIGKIVEDNPSLNLFPGYPGTSNKYSNVFESGALMVHVKAYRQSDNVCVADESYTTDIHGIYDHDTEITLEKNTDYRIAVWSHPLPHADADEYYNHVNFSKVQVIPANYKANTDYRDGFSGVVTVSTGEDDSAPITVNMTRPMGKFELVTTDLSEFLEKETARRYLQRSARADEYKVLISFPLYYPSSYSVFDDRLENSTTGVSFQTQMIVTGTSEASLGFEYVLINDNNDAGVQAKVDIYDMGGSRIAGSSTLTIPMRRDHHTVLRGAFLRYEGSGGVGIDPGFEGDHNVIF